jgi:hypothetical protein
VLIRQVLGAVSQFEKSVIVAKLRGARLRRRRATVVAIDDAALQLAALGFHW